MTIGMWMVVAFVVALALAMARAKLIEPGLELGIEVGLAALLLARLFVIIATGKQCPSCDGGPVVRVALVSFGDQYFRCESCGQRMKRFGLGRRWDASGPDDDHHFHKRREVSTWSDAAIEPTPDVPATRTVGLLLREKRDRDASSEPLVEVDLSDTDPNGGVQTRPANRPAASGVKTTVAERFFRTLDAIRWTRNSRR
jgi:hypothetical protein